MGKARPSRSEKRKQVWQWVWQSGDGETSGGWKENGDAGVWRMKNVAEEEGQWNKL